MIVPDTALSAIPDGLRNPLLEEYGSIVRNYVERRWAPSELSGGKLCEIVYSILDGFAKKSYPTSPAKPPDFVKACRALEGHSSSPRSFQILIPRMLPVLYEVRNNRGVGHVGGDVDPNHMDATAVLSMSNWVMAELVRVYHNLPVAEAQVVVDALVERRVPLVWQVGDAKRVLDPTLSLSDQILLLVASSPVRVPGENLRNWCDCDRRWYFTKILRELHRTRKLEYSEAQNTVEILPPGASDVEALVRAHLGR